MKYVEGFAASGGGGGFGGRVVSAASLATLPNSIYHDAPPQSYGAALVHVMLLLSQFSAPGNEIAHCKSLPLWLNCVLAAS